jgi:hypothetical protein
VDLYVQVVIEYVASSCEVSGGSLGGVLRDVVLVSRLGRAHALRQLWEN